MENRESLCKKELFSLEDIEFRDGWSGNRGEKHASSRCKFEKLSMLTVEAL